MADSFVCAICGKQHAGLITDWAFELPDDVWAIPESERSHVARFTSDLCQFGERYFIRCVLEVPFNDAEGFFGWGVWAEVQWEVFQRYLELYEVDGQAEPEHDGRLANLIPEYPEAAGSTVSVQFRQADKRPALFLKSLDQSPLAREQRSGINQKRYHAIVERLT